MTWHIISSSSCPSQEGGPGCLPHPLFCPRQSHVRWLNIVLPLLNSSTTVYSSLLKLSLEMTISYITVFKFVWYTFVMCDTHDSLMCDTHDSFHNLWRYIEPGVHFEAERPTFQQDSEQRMKQVWSNQVGLTLGRAKSAISTYCACHATWKTVQ